MRKRLLCLCMVTTLVATVVFTGCAKKSSTNDGGNEQTKTENSNTGVDNGSGSNTMDSNDVKKVDFTNFDKRATWDDSAKEVELGDGDVVIEEEGTYILSGTLKNGQIYVNVDDEEKVQLVLNGVDISCESSAAILVENADKVSLTLADGTTNTLSDGGDADGCIHSKDDLSINGTGKLIVKGNVNNGIDCNNDIKIVSGTIEIKAVNNGIKAKETVSIKDGNITVEADDAIKVEDKDDSKVGEFYMEGGQLELKAADDGITAVISIAVIGGTITSDVEGKNTNCDGKEYIKDGCLIKK